ncbi:trigger factor [Ilumatobacter sp.]|uniref:trigger factor n=1 Tax=Ilumatobacter sp. TaxID=1967498 RepID=UPI003B51D951
MKSSVEVLEDNKVKVYVEVEEAEFDKDIDRAFKAIAKEVNLPGFRAGKVPRRVLEARVGIGPAREQALRDAVPEYLARAVKEHDVDLIARPEVEITDGEESGPVEFDATCQVRPVITVEGYDELRVELPAVAVDDDDVEQARQAALVRDATLEPVERPAASGDFVVIDLSATRDGEDVVGLNAEDWSYEIGQGWITDDFDERLVGASAGDVLEFEATPKETDAPADFTVEVQMVQERHLPELTDEWVDANIGDHDTVDGWSEFLGESLRERRLGEARQQAGMRINEALAALVDIEVPEALVVSDLNQRVQGTIEQFQAQGIDFEQWMQATGQDPESFVESMRGQSEIAVKVDLALRAIAVAESIEVGDDELEAEYARMAMQHGHKARDVRRAYEENDAVPELVSQIRKARAFDHLVHHASYVDPDGAEIDRDLLIGDDHDHDHDPDSDGSEPAGTPSDATDQPTDTADATDADATDADATDADATGTTDTDTTDTESKDDA